MKKRLPLLLTVIILALILLSIDVTGLIKTLRGARGDYIFLSVLLIFPIIYLKAERFRFLLRKSVLLDSKEAFLLTAAGFSAAAITPSKAGDLVKALFLKKTRGVALSTGSAIVVFEKMLEVLFLASVTLASLFMIDTRDTSVLIAGAFAGVFILWFILFFLTESFPRIAFGALARLLKGRPKIVTGLESVKGFVLGLTAAELARCLAYTTLMWGVNYVQLYLIFQSVALDIDLFVFLAFMPISLFIGIIPVSISGIGTRDAALLYFFSPYAAEESVIAAALIINVVRVALTGVVGLAPSRKYFKDVIDEPGS